jgi:hypothetical protein
MPNSVTIQPSVNSVEVTMIEVITTMYYATNYLAIPQYKEVGGECLLSSIMILEPRLKRF